MNIIQASINHSGTLLMRPGFTHNLLRLFIFTCAVLAIGLVIQPQMVYANPAPVKQPQAMNQAFADAYNSRDIKQVMALYTTDAQLVNDDHTVAKGLAEIRKVQRELLKIGGHFSAKNLSVVVSGKIALLNARWQIDTTDKDGKPLRLSGFTAEIVQQQPDGNWLYLIDNPFPPRE